MLINIANHDFMIIWDGVYYFALSDYPNVSDWELRKLVTFFDYEKRHGRETEIYCENDEIKKTVETALSDPAPYMAVQRPRLITECTACRHGGCLTDYVCHTAEIENAKSIFICGKILSAAKARGMTGAELATEPRNAAKDPPDYLEHAMFAWGNCQAGDRLVMERTLGRAPDERDLSAGFTPGVRFWFKYETVENHRNFVNDGYHPAKVRDELPLSGNLYRCVIPGDRKDEFAGVIPPDLADRVFYIDNDCGDIWEWSEKVYNCVVSTV